MNVNSFLFKGGVVDGEMLDVPCNERGEPELKSFRVAEHRLMDIKPDLCAIPNLGCLNIYEYHAIRHIINKRPTFIFILKD